ncbi:hypothetical protein IVB69_12185 [Flavobacterium sp. J49]|uniref:hypothetical protein n=1 Tax=Flavobacterium sp. J49 TaxID=2718534 RepID=UPI001593A12F|nr:hypothetical protein [Flavobacterium sp. J49]MBF6642244.1 hypothetical protein [Flavobacterium sp. J49]NIC03490.1 hypothetical protein [Flavobacterium sp. J49]
MKLHSLHFLLGFLFLTSFSFSQETDNTAILKIIFTKYYKNEKVIAKNRLQLLSFYCNKAPNNEEVLEVIAGNELLKKHNTEIKKQIVIDINEDWSKEYNLLFDNQNQYLKSKVNTCLSLEEFQKVSKQYGENNQRLLIVNKPIYFAKNQYALVKVAFYRSIEHNSGRFLLLEKVNNEWLIKEYLNEWAT